MIGVDPKVLSNSLNVTSYIVGDISNVFFEPFLVVKFIIFGRTWMRPGAPRCDRISILPGAPGCARKNPLHDESVHYRKYFYDDYIRDQGVSLSFQAKQFRRKTKTVSFRPMRKNITFFEDQ